MMPTARGEVGAAAVDGRIYVLGAYSGATDANEAYDPVLDSWQTLAPLPRSLNHVCAVGLGGFVYVIGGLDPLTGNRPVDSTYSYDLGSNTWSLHAPMLTPRGALACATVDDVIYAIGGASPAGDTGAVEAYDPTSDTWSAEFASMPTAREHVASAVLDGLIHIVGGRSPVLGATGTTHEVYDPATNSWSTASPLPTGRSGVGAAVLAGRIHVLGGEADHTFAQNEAYDPATDTWLSFAPLPTPRHGLGVVAVSDAIYVVAGGPQPGDSRSNIVEVFKLS
ncbi:MAG: galactose oxidase [Chloroflexota bacterium]|nr:galactose oxidase [Chloroflexota bacterium]